MLRTWYARTNVLEKTYRATEHSGILWDPNIRLSGKHETDSRMNTLGSWFMIIRTGWRGGMTDSHLPSLPETLRDVLYLFGVSRSRVATLCTLPLALSSRRASRYALGVSWYAPPPYVRSRSVSSQNARSPFLFLKYRMGHVIQKRQTIWSHSSPYLKFFFCLRQFFIFDLPAAGSSDSHELWQDWLQSTSLWPSLEREFELGKGYVAYAVSNYYSIRERSLLP